MKKFQFLLLILILLIPTNLFARDDWTKKDNKLFASVIVLQVIDGLTTINGLERGNVITHDWAWKYGTNKPSTELLWGVKTIELIGAYFVGKALPTKWRKGFFIVVDSLLLFCVHHNLKGGGRVYNNLLSKSYNIECNKWYYWLNRLRHRGICFTLNEAVIECNNDKKEGLLN